MKALGVILIAMGTCGGFLIYRHCTTYILRLSRTLMEDLSVLRCQICIHRKSLPTVLSDQLGSGVGSTVFWSPLKNALEQSGRSVRVCWEMAADTLPEPLDRLLSPLGAMIPAGGSTLASAIDEVRQELITIIRVQQEQQPVKLRLAGAMCFSAAALFVLVCI